MRTAACGALLACALVALAAPASAQTTTTFVETRSSGGQDIRFIDDPLGALAGDPIGAQLGGFHPPRRYDLMRPRTTFVPQMLETVENL